MGIRNRKTTIRRELLKYALTLFLSITGILFLYLIIDVIGLNTGFLLPANYDEQKVNQIEVNLKSVDKVSEEMLPEGTLYAVLDKKSIKKLYGNMGEKDLANIRRILDHDDIDDIDFRNGQKVIRGIERENEYCVLQFYLRPQFSSTYLRNNLPNYEITSLCVLGIILIGSIIIITTIYAKGIIRNFKKITSITKSIKEYNLEFKYEHSNIQEIEDIIISLLEMREALRKSLETQWKMEKTKKEQIGALAHDIKIPITIIKGNAELLRLSNLSAEQSTLNNYIIKAGDRIEQYIGLLIDISKMEDILSIQRNKIDVKNFVKEIFEDMMKAYICDKGVELVLEDDQLPFIEGYFDNKLMRRALMNILSNAVRYTPEGERIVFTVGYVSNLLSFTITDTGEGFTPESLEKATQLFYTENKGRDSEGNYGIGLTFVQNVVNLHGGVLNIQNEVRTGGGQVTIKIPLSF